MFCGKCGKQIPDESVLCPECGEKLEQVAEQVAEPTAEQAVETAQPVVETEATEPVENEAVAEESVQPSEDAQPVDIKPVKKKAKWVKPLIFVALPLVLVVAVVLMNLGPIIGFTTKTFGSNEDYLIYVENQQLDAAIDSFTAIYDNLFAESNTDISSETEVKINLSDSILGMLKQALGTDISWINGLSFNVNANVKDDIQSVMIKLMNSGEEIIGAEAILDMENKEGFFGVPELASKYLSVNLKNLEENGAELSVFGGYFTNFDQNKDMLKAALPDGETLNKLINKYTDIALKSVEGVEKSTETVKIEDVEQNLTVLKMNITEKIMANMVVNILKELKADKEIETIIKTFIENIPELADELDGDDIYEEFIDFIDEGIEELGQEEGDNTLITLCDYVNSKHQIVGRTIGEPGSGVEVLRNMFVREGEKVAFELIVGPSTESIKIAGVGTEKNGVFNGGFDFAVENDTIFKFEAKDFNLKKLSNGLINGTLRIEPGKSLLDRLNKEIGMDLSTFDPAIQLKFSSTEKTANMSVSLQNGNNALFGIDASSKVGEGKEITKPEDTVNAENENDLAEWVEDLDTTKLMDKLEKLGITDLIQQIVMAQSGMNNAPNQEIINDDYLIDDDFMVNYSPAA